MLLILCILSLIAWSYFVWVAYGRPRRYTDFTDLQKAFSYAKWEAAGQILIVVIGIALLVLA